MSSPLSVQHEEPGAEHALLHTLLQEPPARRVPHMGHAILFALLSYFLINVAGFLLVTLHAPHGAEQFRAIAQQPTLRVEAQGLAYLLTIGISWTIFPLMWDRSFSEGIRWNFAVARSFAVVLVPLGIVFGMVMQFLSGLGPSPKEMPINEFFRHSSDVWLITIFGTLLGPLYEEIAFRGFFLPAVATAYDWLSIRRTAEGFQEWSSSTKLSRTSIVISAVLTSILFALMHAQQLANAWWSVTILFGVSMALTYVRVQLRSVAASAILHASYNLFVFAGLFIATGGYRHLDRFGH